MLMKQMMYIIYNYVYTCYKYDMAFFRLFVLDTNCLVIAIKYAMEQELSSQLISVAHTLHLYLKVEVEL